jgi:hypothetical protein
VSCSRISQCFMETGDSLPCSQKSPLVPNLRNINPIYTVMSYFCKIHLNIFHLRLILPNGFFIFNFLPNSVYMYLLLHSCYIPCLSDYHWVHHSNCILRRVQVLRSSSLCSFLQLYIVSSIFRLDIFNGTLFSNTISLCSFLKIKDKVPHPH